VNVEVWAAVPVSLTEPADELENVVVWAPVPESRTSPADELEMLESCSPVGGTSADQ
jgi:hypothetical protein